MARATAEFDYVIVGAGAAGCVSWFQMELSKIVL
jgi:succinate dehydrogenase/fumarate reductase flavoprotein subunit